MTMLNLQRLAAMLFVLAGVVAFARVAMGVARGTGVNTYELAMGVLAMVLAYFFGKVWAR